MGLLETIGAIKGIGGVKPMAHMSLCADAQGFRASRARNTLPETSLKIVQGETGLIGNTALVVHSNLPQSPETPVI